MSFSVTTNQILYLSILQEVLLVFFLLGPFIGLGIHSVIICATLSLLYFLFVRQATPSCKTQPSSSLLGLLKAVSIGSASSILPLLILLYFIAESWIKFMAVLSVVLCGFGCNKAISCAEKLRKDSKMAEN
jgi:hypothetical protein